MKNKKDEKQFTMEDLVRMQDDIRKVVDINKPDNELTADQLVKKIMHRTLGDILEKNMGKDFMEKLQNYRNQTDQLNILSSNWEKLIELGRKIEKIFIIQRAGLEYHFDHSEENFYRKNVDEATTETLKNKNLSNEQRLDSAHRILNLIKVYREKMVVDLNTQQDKIYDLLSGFENRLRETPFDFFKEDKDIYKKSLLEEWLMLSWKLHEIRKKVVKVVDDHLDADEIIPKYILEKNGDVSGKMSATDMFSKMDRVVILSSEGNKAEKDIQEKRSKISEELFGKADDYINLETDEDIAILEKDQNKRKIGSKMKWFIVIGLSITALSWGIWTAIGVFILGVIIINVLFQK